MPKQRYGQSLALALLAATMLTPPTAARAEPGDPLGDEFQVNSYANNGQEHPAVAMDAAGDFVVVWQSAYQDGTPRSIFAQRYDSTGARVGIEFPVNRTTASYQTEPAVAMDADGDFVVVWQSLYQDDSSYGVYAQRFDAAGAIQGEEIPVNTYTENAQNLPAVAMDDDGNFVVVWQSGGQDGELGGIYAQRFDAAGAKQGQELKVNTTTADTQLWPAVGMDAGGNFVVAWTSNLQDGSRLGVYAQRFDPQGGRLDGEIPVNSTIANHQSRPAVAVDADGDFVIAWQSAAQDGSGFGIYAQRFDAAGAKQGGELHVSTSTDFDQELSAVAMDADGDFVVAWQDFPAGVFAQRYNAAGQRLGGQFQVDMYDGSIDQRFPSIALDADGDVVVTWDSFYQDGNSFGVYARRYQGLGPVPNDFTVDGRSDIVWRNTGTGDAILWQMDGFDWVSGGIGAPDTLWQVKGLADFDADTRTDILWRSTATGMAVIWEMEGFVKEASAPIGAPGADWRIVGTGDFDGDDHADILWRNITSGAALIWKMDGFSKEAVAVIGKPPVAWQVAGVGDFDADATSDILWRNTDTGQTVAWKMVGLAKDSSAGIGRPDLLWQVEGLADFDADARSDILWRNTDTGATVVWKMDGLSKAASATIGKPPLVWELEGAGDTDGGRKADILWRNADTDKAVIWKMDGFTKVDSQTIGTVPAVWEVQ